MGAALLVLLALSPNGGATQDPAQESLQDPLQETRRLRIEGRYSEALELTAGIPDLAQRAFERLEVRYYAGDLGGALREALAGLAVAPDDRMLLWRGSRLAIDLLATERAVHMARRLRAVVETDSNLPPVEREWWAEEAGKLTDAAADLEHTDAERRNALLRARASVAVIALGVLLAAGWLSRGPRRAQAAGTG